jgi:hypothetical protein
MGRSTNFWNVPRCWPGETFFLLAGGPSLSGFDSEVLRGHGRIIVINDSYLLCPFADVLYHCDRAWLFAPVAENMLKLASSFAGKEIPSGSLHRDVIALIFKGTYRVSMGTSEFGTHQIRSGGLTGLSSDSSRLSHGTNSGYQAINLAVHLGASRIILLGYDMHCNGGMHFHNSPGRRADYHLEFEKKIRLDMLPRFAGLVHPLAALGIEVVNCTPGSAITCWPNIPLGQVLHPVPVQCQ